jgi:hypothetical protein
MKNRHIAKKTARWIDRSRVRGIRRSVYVHHSFSEVEDNTDAFRIIRNLAADAGNNAAAEAKAAGLPCVYIRNNKDLYKVFATGAEIQISPKIKQAFFYVKYKPSTILHAVKR